MCRKGGECDSPETDFPTEGVIDNYCCGPVISLVRKPDIAAESMRERIPVKGETQRVATSNAITDILNYH